MYPKFHTAIGYRLFSQLTQQINISIHHKVFSVLDYSKESVERRLVQRFSELGLDSFMKVASDYSKTESKKSILDMKRLQFGGIRCDPSSGNLGVGIPLLCKSLIEFSVHWLLVLFAHVQALFSFRQVDQRPATLVIGVGTANFHGLNKDLGFINFCKEGPVKPLREATSLIVMDVAKASSSEPSYVEYDHFPLFALVRRKKLGVLDFICFLVSHLKIALLFSISILRFPLLATIGRDFAYHAMVVRLNKNKTIENVVISNSNYASQPLWMVNLMEREFYLHMVWYSQNSIPFLFQWDAEISAVPGFQHIRVDETWVWTESFSNYLRGLGIPGHFHDVGPILWYLPELEIKKEENKERLCITVFDVTPVSPDKEEQLGIFYNYYSSKNVSKFIKDIIYSVKIAENKMGETFQISLKHKRSHHSIHDRNYIELISTLSERTAEIFLVEPDLNLFSLVQESDLVIVIPYSSPAHVAKHLGVPTVYYDPTEELVFNHEKEIGISFVSGQAELVKYLNTLN